MSRVQILKRILNVIRSHTDMAYNLNEDEFKDPFSIFYYWVDITFREWRYFENTVDQFTRNISRSRRGLFYA
jgi:hypothetical protein